MDSQQPQNLFSPLTSFQQLGQQPKILTWFGNFDDQNRVTSIKSIGHSLAVSLRDIRSNSGSPSQSRTPIGSFGIEQRQFSKMKKQNLDFIEGFDVIYNGEFDSPFTLEVYSWETKEQVRVSIHKSEEQHNASIRGSKRDQHVQVTDFRIVLKIFK